MGELANLQSFLSRQESIVFYLFSWQFVYYIINLQSELTAQRSLMFNFIINTRLLFIRNHIGT